LRKRYTKIRQTLVWKCYWCSI